MKSRIHEIDEEHIALAEMYRDNYCAMYPELSNQIKRYYDEKLWCDTIEKLIRIEQYTLEEIEETLEFVLGDPFWHLQIRSFAGLRKKGKNGYIKFDNIRASMLS